MTVVFILLNLLMLLSSYVTIYRFSASAGFSEKLISTFLLYISQITFSLLLLGVVLKNLSPLPIILLNTSLSLLVVFTLKKYTRVALPDFYHHCRTFFSFLLGCKSLQKKKEFLRHPEENTGSLGAPISAPKDGPLGPSWVGAASPTRDVFLYILLFLFFFQVALLFIKIYFLPPQVWDVFAYHLHPVAEWLQNGMIPASIDTPVLRLNRNPMGLKLLHFWIAGFTHDITWIELPQFVYGLMTVLTSYALMLKMNISKINALKYALSIYFIPLILIESRTCQDHLALMGALLIAAFYFIAVFLEKKDSYIPFLGLSFGLLLGIKISGPHILIVFFLALLLSKGPSARGPSEGPSDHLPALLSERRGFLRFPGFRGKDGFFRKLFQTINKRNIRLSVLGIIAAFTLGGYWYFKDISIPRSYLRTISRLFRSKSAFVALLVLAAFLLLRWGFKKFQGTKVFKNKKVIAAGIILIVIISGAALFYNADLINTFVLGQKSPKALLADSSFYAQHPLLKAVKSDFTRNLLVFPFRIKDIGLYMEYSPDFLEQSGFGVQFFSLGLIAYVVMTVLIFKEKYRAGIMGFVYIFSVVLLGTYFFYYYSSANYRLFMFFPVFGIMLWAFLCTKFDPPKFFLRFLDLLLIGMVLFNISVTLFEGNADKKRWKTLLTMDNPTDRTSIQYSPFFKGEDWIFIDHYIPPEEPIGYLAHMDSWIFPYFDYRMKRRIYHLRSLEGFRLVESVGERNRLELNPVFKESLIQRKIHFLHINPHGARHLKKRFKSIFIEDPEVIRVTSNLYYFSWPRRGQPQKVLRTSGRRPQPIKAHLWGRREFSHQDTKTRKKTCSVPVSRAPWRSMTAWDKFDCRGLIHQTRKVNRLWQGLINQAPTMNWSTFSSSPGEAHRMRKCYE